MFLAFLVKVGVECLEEMCIGRWERIVRAYVSEFGIC